MQRKIGSRRRVATALVFGLIGSASVAQAAPLALSGDYIEVGISDYGTFGSDGSKEPGILHDPTGKANFYPGGVANDYLTPGSPHDGFAISSSETGFVNNDNNGKSSFGTTNPVVLSGGYKGYSLAATWTGTVFSGGGAALATVTNTYYFNPGDERINVATTITAGSSGLRDLYFGRSEDPDPDVNRFGSYDTVNTRGDARTAPNNLVSGAGAKTGLTIGILNTSTTYASNTDISRACCSNSDPSSVFNGTDSGDYLANYPLTDSGDFGLQMAWKIGMLDANASTTIDYAYVLGTHQGSVTVPGVPLPASLPMFGAALMILAGFKYGAHFWKGWKTRGTSTTA